MFAEIVMAHAYSPKYQTYTVAAYVLESGHAGLPKGHTFKVLHHKTTGPELEIEQHKAFVAMHKNNARHPARMEVTNRGKKTFELVESWNF